MTDLIATIVGVVVGFAIGLIIYVGALDEYEKTELMRSRKKKSLGRSSKKRRPPRF